MNAPSKNLAALWIRAAFHEAGTFDPADQSGNTGGTDGSLVYTVNMTENAGLENTIADRFVPLFDRGNISKADTIAIGGLVSVKHCGGPDIPFRGGRVDVQPNAVRFENVNRIPGMSEAYASVKTKMLRMGFTPVDIATLGKFC